MAAVSDSPPPAPVGRSSVERLVERVRPAAIAEPVPIIGGVAAHIASRIGASVLVVRVAFVVLMLAAGWGAVGYAVAWMLVHGRVAEHPGEVTLRHNLGVVAATAAQAVLLVDVVDGIQGTLLWPVLLVAFAVALSEPSVRGASPDRAPTRGGDRGRILAGLALMSAGFVAAIATSTSVRTLMTVAPAAVVLAGGFGLVLTPWIRRVLAGAAADRRDRARAEARADMAAHLHDSVLQTLTLIQNRADEPAVAAALAHRQERELRGWLYGLSAPADGPGASLRAAIETAAGEVEDQYLRVIECVVVADTEMDDVGAAVLGAAREAMINAAKFAHAPRVSVFAEVGDVGDGRRSIDVFVRDRGRGFDPDAVPPDRRGIADSIHDRVARIGGRATVTSSLGVGTEVHIRWPA